MMAGRRVRAAAVPLRRSVASVAEIAADIPPRFRAADALPCCSGDEEALRPEEPAHGMRGWRR